MRTSMSSPFLWPQPLSYTLSNISNMWVCRVKHNTHWMIFRFLTVKEENSSWSLNTCQFSAKQKFQDEKLCFLLICLNWCMRPDRLDTPVDTCNSRNRTGNRMFGSLLSATAHQLMSVIFLWIHSQIYMTQFICRCIQYIQKQCSICLLSVHEWQNKCLCLRTGILNLNFS